MKSEEQIINECLTSLYNPNIRVNDNYCLAFITPETFNHLEEALSTLRRLKRFTGEDYHILLSIYRHHLKNFFKIRDKDREQPRVIAQKFIGKKNVRKFIFNRDGNKCLKCSSIKKLQLDHINPISRGGENIISNLQTLCNSCNSKKRDTFKDYRNGSR